MARITKGNFEYDLDVFNSIRTRDKFEKRYKNATGYEKYMLGRRGSDFNYFALCQEHQVHQVAQGSETTVWCTCGLIVPTERQDIEWNSKNPQPSPGHWDHITNAPARLLIMEGKLICMGCDLRQDVEENEDGWPIVDWDAALAAHAARLVGLGLTHPLEH